MNPLEILGNEHGLIRQALDSLSLAKEKLEAGERPKTEFFEKALEFARTFVLKYHHFKEEHVMFGLLAQRKNGAIDAQLESLRYQHERGRDFIGEIAKSLEGYGKGQEVQSSALLENLAAYVSLLRHHIHREDHVFYPLVERELTEGEMKDLAKAFEREEAKFGEGVGDKARRLVREMGALL